jgi:hypothetical protein
MTSPPPSRGSPDEMGTPMEIVIIMLVLGALPIVAAVLLRPRGSVPTAEG